jgi:hypothetical protein
MNAKGFAHSMVKISKRRIYMNGFFGGEIANNCIKTTFKPAQDATLLFQWLTYDREYVAQRLSSKHIINLPRMHLRKGTLINAIP